MANAPKVTKRQKGLRIDLELDAKVRYGFSRPGDKDDTPAYIRALEEATRNVELPAEAYEEIAAKKRANEAKRHGTH